MDTEIYFAPLQGYTDAALRECFDINFGNITQYYTPFIRIEKEGIRRHDLNDISFERNKTLIEKNLITPQILPGNKDEMKILIETIKNKGFNKIDINLGCPFPLITKKHKGCGMLPHPNEVEDLLKEINNYQDVTFSIKMRLGFHQKEEWQELANIINDSKIGHIVLHPRTGDQQYNGEIQLNEFEKFYSSIKHPIIYNGEIKTKDDAENILRKYPLLKGIMIGRGLLQNPFLAEEIMGKKELSPNVKIQKIKTFNEDLINLYSKYYEGGDNQVLKKMTLLWEYLFPQMDKKFKKKILKSKSIEDYRYNIEIALSNIAVNS